jgi:omega-amidase
VQLNEACALAPAECWNSPYATSSFPVYAEPVPTSSAQVRLHTPTSELLALLL